MSRRFISLLVLLVSLFTTTGAFARGAEPKGKDISSGAPVISTWNIINAEWSEVDQMAYDQLRNTAYYYDQYYDAFTPGTEPGQYGEAEVAAFRAALDKVAELDNPDSNLDNLTAEDFNRMAKEIETAYEAVLKSIVNISLADGYYRIRNGGLIYIEYVTDEETGEQIQPVIVDKYMYVTKNGTTLNGVWGSVEDLGSDAPSLWKVTNMGDSQYVLENMAFEAQFNPSTGTSAPFTLQTDHTELMCITASAHEDDNIYVNIRVASQTGDYVYLHQGGHANGAGKGGNVLAWSANAEPSQWLFVPVSDEDAQKIIEDYAPIKMLANYRELMANAKANLEIAKGRIVEVKAGEKMITSSSQFSSPYTEESEGSIEYMLDNDNFTFWHSQWSGGEVPMDYHYLQVEIKDVNVETAVAVIGRRNTPNDHVTAMNVRGTNDPDAEKDECELLANIKTPFVKPGEMGVMSNIFELKGYKYLRFYPTTTERTSGIDNRGYFHLAEFQLHSAIIEQSAMPQSITLGELFTNLEAVVNAQEGLNEEDIHIEEYNALKEAYDAFMERFVDPTLLRKMIVKLNGISLGTELGQYQSTISMSDWDSTKIAIDELVDNGAYRDALDLMENLFAHTTINQPKGKFVNIFCPEYNAYLLPLNDNGYAGAYQYNSTGIYYVTEDGNLWNYNSGRFTKNISGMRAADYGDMGATWRFDDAQGLEGEGKYNLWDSSNGYLLCGIYNGTDSSEKLFDSESEKRAAWRFIEVTEVPVTITDAGYATLYSPVALYIPEGVTVYTGMVNEDNTVLTMNQVENVIPAETAVVLKGMPGDYRFGVAGMKGEDVDNDLEGTLAGIADANGILTLQDIDGIGFYRYTGGVLAGNKAYLSPDRAAGVKGLSFDFGLTDNITTVEGETTEKAVIYNLSGQRVEKAVQGVYIVNGKKVMVK